MKKLLRDISLKKVEMEDMNLFFQAKTRKETRIMKVLYRKQMTYGMNLQLEEKARSLKNSNSKTKIRKTSVTKNHKEIKLQ